MEGSSLLKLTTTLDQGPADQTPQKLQLLWNALTQPEPGGSYAAEKFILRWMLKTMTGPSPEAETVRRYPLAWAIMGCVFSRIPLFSMAKTLADRKFISLLQQTFKDLSSPAGPQGGDGNVEMADAKPASSKTLKRKRSQEVPFDLGVLRESRSCLRSAEQLFAALRVLLSRISPDHIDPKSNDRMGAEHIRSLFCSPAAGALTTLSSSLTICQSAINQQELDTLEGQDTWISTAVALWELHLRSASDAIEFALHLSNTCCSTLDEILSISKASSTTTARKVTRAWTRDLKGLMTKNFILPARSEYFNQKTTEIISTPVRQGRLSPSVSCPVLFRLVLEAPQAIGGASTKKDNKEWLDAVFDLLEAALRHLTVQDRSAVMRDLLSMALEHNCTPALSSLLYVCQTYAWTDDTVDWTLVSSLAECDADVFLTSDQGRVLLDEILQRAPNGTVTDSQTYDALCSMMLSLAGGFVRARQFPKFVRKWFDSLRSCSISTSTKSTKGIFWLDARISQAVSGALQESLTTKQLTDLVNDIAQAGGVEAEAARAVVFDAICQGITTEEFMDTAGASLFEHVWSSPTSFTSIEVSSAQWRVAAKAVTWGVVEDSWKSISSPLKKKLKKASTADADTFEAFRCAVAAWASSYCGDGSVSEPEKLLVKFLDRLDSELKQAGLRCDDSVLKQYAEGQVTDAFGMLPLCATSATTYAAWAVFYYPSLLRMLSTSSHDHSEFFHVLFTSATIDNGSEESARQSSLEALSTGLATAVVGIPRDRLSANIITPIIDMLSNTDGSSTASKSRMVASSILTKLPGECLSRADRERIVASLHAQAQDSSASEWDAATWQSVLGVIVQIMGKPTFYKEMNFGALVELGNSLKRRLHKDRKSVTESARSVAAFKLFVELANLTLRQMTASSGTRETTYVKDVWPVISDSVGKKGRGSDRLVPLTLLAAFVAGLEQSSASKQFSMDVTLRNKVESELVRMVVATFEEMFNCSDKKPGVDVEACVELRAAILASNVHWTPEIGTAVAGLKDKIMATSQSISQTDAEVGALLSAFIVERLDSTTIEAIKMGGLEDGELSKLDIAEIIRRIDRSVPVGEDAVKAVFLRDLATKLDKDGDETLLLAARRVVREGLDVAEESAATLSAAQNMLTQHMVSSPSTSLFIDGARTIHPLLDQKGPSVTQWNVEHALSSIAVLCSDKAPHVDAIRSSPRSFDWLCLLAEAVLKRHRRRLEGHLHLLVTVLQSLLVCLLRHPYDESNGAWAEGHQVSARLEKRFPHWERQAKVFARLVTLVCEPSAASVMRGGASGTAALESATDAAKRSAGRYMYLVLMRLIKLELEGDVPHRVREALVPGVNSILDITPVEMRRVMVDAMDAGARVVWKDMFEKYRRFGKWKGA